MKIAGSAQGLCTVRRGIIIIIIIILCCSMYVQPSSGNDDGRDSRRSDLGVVELPARVGPRMQ